MKQADIANQFGNMIANVTGTPQQSGFSGGFGINGGNQVAVGGDFPSELEDDAPIFTVDHNDEDTKCKKKALLSVVQIVNSIVPKKYQEDEIIKDKMVLDSEQLGELYYQQHMNKVMQQALMGVVAKGDTNNKNFDSFTKMQDQAKQIAKQITELQNEFRKYYIDTYLDMQQKEQSDVEETTAVASLEGGDTKKLNASTEQPKKDDGVIENRFVSTKDSTKYLQELKKQKFKAKMADTSTN